VKFVVATTSRRNPGETLFMVDRAKQRASFWSNRLDDVYAYDDRAAAERKAASLRFNRPRVLSLQDAASIVAALDDERAHQQAMDDSEAGWDGHKSSF